MLPASAKPGGAPQSRTPFSVTSWGSGGHPTYNQEADCHRVGPRFNGFPILPAPKVNSKMVFEAEVGVE